MKKRKKRADIKIPQFDMYFPNDYSNMKPEEFIKHIDKELKRAVAYIQFAKMKTDLRELLIRWGTWSRNMNVILRRNISESGGKASMQYKLAYAYWWNRAQYLETYQKSFFGQIADRKAINEGKKNIQNMIASDMDSEQIKNVSKDFYDLVEKLSKKRELSKEETERALDGDETVRKNEF